MKRRNQAIAVTLVGCMTAAALFAGCGGKENTGKTEIEIVQYKPEAAKYFDELEEEFNATHDDIHLTIDSPNDASTILRTRFIREDYPDIIGIGGDINYSYYVDAGILADVSDYEGLKDIKSAYLDIEEALEIVPTEGTYAVPYVANAAGILYNRDLFEEHGWKIPNTWEELMTLCEDIKSEGILPFYFGFKDTWTCLAPWNSMAVDLAPSDVCKQVNRGETTFSKEYEEVSEKYLELLNYGPEDPFAYGYNDACTAFANGQSAMYPIGSYAVPQILSVNPEMNIDSFVMPAGDTAEQNTLNSGVDLHFCVTEDSPNKEAAYEVLDFLLEDENIQKYIDDQNAIPCKEGEFELAPMLDGMNTFIEEGNMTDFQDHYYPSEMAVDAQIQTFLINKDVDAFLQKFDKDWQRYNRDTIRKVQEYEENHGENQ
ncbi:sugar ABC transporter substrate-binding protein [Blautia sp. An249]|uniref:ABC transporter substrate-binding protein n=1 Tax=Blautia sp. An249 TaxID=1965603 RepID=UPI000B38F3E5|nr:extracellular solute-binding protein [Blautia sp. An249]OUO80786.1 sugar ABC transporter substrate-binding protein [Blautia sp. An249]